MITLSLLVVIIGAVGVGFYMAWTIGANDVANAMGVPVGSGTLTIKRAIILACVFEVIGAVLVGAHVTDTIKGGIVDPKPFLSQEPSLLMYGMFAALLGAALWVTVATYFALPISTSQAIVGALIGFGVTSVELGFVEFSAMHLEKIGEIALSWVISPLAGGMIGFLMFLIISKFVLRSATPVKASKKVVPILASLVSVILTLSIIYKGLKNLGLHRTDPLVAVGLSIVVGVAVALISSLWLRGYAPKKGIDQIAQVEVLFGYLLVLTACYIAFAHGANDVGNAVGPIAVIISTGQEKVVETLVSINPVYLILGGFAICAGVVIWGYRVIETIGKRITGITPTSGFAAMFSAATVMLVCSKFGLPISSSQIIVGAVVGVGLGGGIRAIDTAIIGKIIVSWVVTIPVAAGITAALYLGFLGIT